jgi:hypothetical protein
MPGHELKAQTRLEVSGSRLSARDLVSAVVKAAEEVKVPLLSKPQRLKVTKNGSERAEFAITVVTQHSPLATFTVIGADRSNGGSVRVGGLERYRVDQDRALGFIPTGPKKIPAFALYAKFLDDVQQAISRQDARATISRVP